MEEGFRKQKKKLEHWEVIALYLFCYDVVAVNFAYFAGLWLRFDFHFSEIPQECLHAFFKFSPFYTVFSVAVFKAFNLYNSLWRFASFSELNRILAATGVTTVFQAVGITAFLRRMPLSYYIIGAMTQFMLVTGVRFAYRYILMERARREKSARAVHNVMVVGAGAAGKVILGELLGEKNIDAQPCCIIDDNPNKWGRFVDGVPVVGGRDDIFANVEKYKINQILVAIPTATAEQKREILDICKETGCEIKSLPGVYQLVNGEVSLSRMKAVDVEDLLGRKPIRVNMEEIFRHLRGKVILVTGGGGSIGSELCRQIAGHGPKRLIIFDIYENNAYDIEQELKMKYPELDLVVLVGSVRDSGRVDHIFEEYRPDIVYHAAAHKHVPLMEDSPCEAVKNNVIGTYKTAYAALHNGCQKFVLISTDKAVNPTNVMGATKRLCEMVVQSMDKVGREGLEDLLPLLNFRKGASGKGRTRGPGKGRRTEFVAVRFGNVLGSNGSVIPLFRRQIKAGGPVTVTHPDIIRYFMTIPEAVSLVLQAGAYAEGGEIFVLDMGAPVKIDTLARNLIKLSGYKPDEDIRIVYTGLRPGEKLYEEKLMEEEGLARTPNELIHIGKPIPMDVGRFFRQLERLADYSYREDPEVIEVIAEAVATYRPADMELPARYKSYSTLAREAAGRAAL